MEDMTLDTDIRQIGYMRMSHSPFVLYNAFMDKILEADNIKWPPDEIRVWDGIGEYIYKKSETVDNSLKFQTVESP